MLDWLISTRVAADIAVLILLKATVLLSLVMVIEWSLRRRSAAVRHRVWLMGLVGLLVLPVVPSVTVGEKAPNLHYPAETMALGPEAIHVRATTTDAPAVDAEGVAASLPVWSIVLLVWWAGVTFALVRLARDVAQVWLLCHSAMSVTPGHPAHDLLDVERERLGIRRSVRLLCSDRPGWAATVGSFRPAVILGREVLAMPHGELRSILLHELAHIRRGDFLVGLLTSLAMIVYWPNPLFWIARRRAAEALERACDDEVLERGVRPVQYAKVLLDCAVSQPGLSPAMRSTMGLLRFSATRDRILSVLDGHQERTRRGTKTALSAVAGVGAVIVLLGAWTPLTYQPGTGPTDFLIEALGHPDATVREQAALTLSRRDPGPARVDLEALLDDPVPEVRLAAAGALHQLGSPESIPAMGKVLERPFGGDDGEHGFVLKLAMKTLARTDRQEAVRLLVEQLDRPVPPLRRLALEELAYMPSHGREAQPHLERFARQDPDSTNRAWARATLSR